MPPTPPPIPEAPISNRRRQSAGPPRQVASSLPLANDRRVAAGLGLRASLSDAANEAGGDAVQAHAGQAIAIQEALADAIHAAKEKFKQPEDVDEALRDSNDIAHRGIARVTEEQSRGMIAKFNAAADGILGPDKVGPAFVQRAAGNSDGNLDDFGRADLANRVQAARDALVALMAESNDGSLKSVLRAAYDSEQLDHVVVYAAETLPTFVRADIEQLTGETLAGLRVRYFARISPVQWATAEALGEAIERLWSNANTSRTQITRISDGRSSMEARNAFDEKTADLVVAVQRAKSIPSLTS